MQTRQVSFRDVFVGHEFDFGDGVRNAEGEEEAVVVSFDVVIPEVGHVQEVVQVGVDEACAVVVVVALCALVEDVVGILQGWIRYCS